MTKYDGIEKPESVLIESDNIVQKKAERGHGFLTRFLVRFLIAGVLAGALFGLKAAAFEFSSTVTDTVKNAGGADFMGGGTGEYFLDKIIALFGNFFS